MNKTKAASLGFNTQTCRFRLFVRLQGYSTTFAMLNVLMRLSGLTLAVIL